MVVWFTLLRLREEMHNINSKQFWKVSVRIDLVYLHNIYEIDICLHYYAHKSFYSFQDTVGKCRVWHFSSTRSLPHQTGWGYKIGPVLSVSALIGKPIDLPIQNLVQVLLFIYFLLGCKLVSMLLYTCPIGTCWYWNFADMRILLIADIPILPIFLHITNTQIILLCG